MLDNYNIHLISGGLYDCNPRWNRRSCEVDRCYKFYLPISGSAFIGIKEEQIRLAPGRVYFIDGHQLQWQRCDKSMRVYWVHIVPESFYLDQFLTQTSPIHTWPLNEIQWIKAPFRRVSELFDAPYSDHSLPVFSPPIGLSLQMRAVLMSLLADVIEKTQIEDSTSQARRSMLQRLKPAIDFMDSEYLHNPCLNEIASRTGLAPNYFHRIFRREVGITPFGYMERRRLNVSRRLLGEGRLSIKEIAARCGYENPLYFSRAFRKVFALSPSKYIQNATDMARRMLP